MFVNVILKKKMIENHSSVIPSSYDILLKCHGKKITYHGKRVFLTPLENSGEKLTLDPH